MGSQVVRGTPSLDQAARRPPGATQPHVAVEGDVQIVDAGASVVEWLMVV
ncbi:hypothetical protein [Streptomyces litchfieldiae]|nr:hypothetical protein [Streptomyces sp. DSM 44938]